VLNLTAGLFMGRPFRIETFAAGVAVFRPGLPDRRRIERPTPGSVSFPFVDPEMNPEGILGGIPNESAVTASRL